MTRPPVARPGSRPVAATRSTARRRLLAAALVGAAGVASTRWRPAHALAPEATARVLAERLAERGVGYTAVQVEPDGRVQVTVAGQASAASPLTADGRFEIGSLTKTFTALLLADAVVRRELALDGAVEEVLGDVRLRDAAGQPIRWVDLATHRSGLPRLADNMAPTNPADPYADEDEARLLAFLRSWRPQQIRGAEWSYSNLGYGLMGWALGRRIGGGYAAALSSRVLQPLGLRETELSMPGRTVTARVDGHDAQKRRVPPWTFGEVAAGAGALVMSPADVGRYLQAALGHVPTPLAEAFTLAQARHAEGPSAANPQALAWLRAPLAGRTVLLHDGGTYGFSSSTWLDPERRRGVSLLANAFVEVNDLALHLVEPSIPPKDFAATRQTEVAVSPGDLAPLAGRYAVSPSFAIEISVRDGQLWAQATGQGAFQLFAAAPRRWFARVTPLEIVFEPGDPPPAFTLSQGGQRTRFGRAP